MLTRAAIYKRAGPGLKSLIWLLTAISGASSAAAEPQNGIAMHGALLHSSDFKHFNYARPAAPKGGRLVLGVQGSFDSLNPLIVRGVAAAGVRAYVYESLMARGLDEPFSLYGLVAESVEAPDDRSWVSFTLRPEARFSDGKPITVDDIVFSHALLRDKGRPNHRSYYSKVTKVETLGERTVKFTFTPDGDREMPLIMGLMPVLPRHAMTPEAFEKTSLTGPVGSGPYRVSSVNAGASVTYARDPDYWGRDLAVNKGRFNFDEIRYDYYRDANAMFEAFKKGLFDVWPESDPGRWAQGYDFPAAKDGRVEKLEVPIGLPSGMRGLVFNTRRPQFADKRVREALTLVFDFEWINKNLYHGLYTRTQSFFDRSELSSHGKPANAREKELLAPFPDAVSAKIMAGTASFPSGDASGRNRGNLRRALKLLKSAGYTLKDGILINAKTGAAFAFEIPIVTRSQERLFLSYARALKRIGIDARIRQVDSAQYQRRRQTFDYDVVEVVWYASLSPGNEQSFRWGSQAADREGSFNFAGVKSKAVDAMIQAVLEAKDRAAFVSAVRALDRVLLSGNYVLPLFHLPKQWVARQTRVSGPENASLFGYQLSTWWHKPSN